MNTKERNGLKKAAEWEARSLPESIRVQRIMVMSRYINGAREKGRMITHEQRVVLLAYMDACGRRKGTDRT